MKVINDGKTHINVYSKAKTILGKMLSNFSSYYIDTPYGRFASLEGYWYWLVTGKQHNELRIAYGFKAKELGRKLLNGLPEWDNSPGFRLRIVAALLNKIIQHEEIEKEFIKNDLPFDHYYVYGDKVITVPNNKWINDFLNFLREEIIKE